MIGVLYVATRFLNRIVQFIRDWYVGGFNALVHRALLIFGRLDRFLALRVTLHHMFEPLYQDRSVLGRILGLIFRSVRVVVALLIYGVIALVFLAIYVAWAAIPLLLIYFLFADYGIT
ncbi:MAG: hypothetical protein M1361_00355 [Patescibacteria group bacterium]|nr:hypothetical protein [Patescibacteria group bacterium]MCL5224066.1 hypothetical protein [Patescibacteria group bacterium]